MTANQLQLTMGKSGWWAMTTVIERHSNDTAGGHLLQHTAESKQSGQDDQPLVVGNCIGLHSTVLARGHDNRLTGTRRDPSHQHPSWARCGLVVVRRSGEPRRRLHTHHHLRPIAANEPLWGTRRQMALLDQALVGLHAFLRDTAHVAAPPGVARLLQQVRPRRLPHIYTSEVRSPFSATQLAVGGIP